MTTLHRTRLLQAQRAEELALVEKNRLRDQAAWASMPVEAKRRYSEYVARSKTDPIVGSDAGTWQPPLSPSAWAAEQRLSAAEPEWSASAVLAAQIVAPTTKTTITNWVNNLSREAIDLRRQLQAIDGDYSQRALAAGLTKRIGMLDQLVGEATKGDDYRRFELWQADGPRRVAESRDRALPRDDAANTDEENHG